MAKTITNHQPPEQLFIADPKERLMNMLVDEMFDRLVSEVEAEEEQRLTDEASIAETGLCTGS